MDKRVRCPRSVTGVGRRFWRDATGAYSFRVDELALLEQVCMMLSTIDDLATLAASAEPLVEGSAGQLRANPLWQELRQQRLALGTLLRQLRLPDPPQPVDVGSMRQRAAQHAARARYR